MYKINSIIINIVFSVNKFFFGRNRLQYRIKGFIPFNSALQSSWDATSAQFLSKDARSNNSSTRNFLLLHLRPTAKPDGPFTSHSSLCVVCKERFGAFKIDSGISLLNHILDKALEKKYNVYHCYLGAVVTLRITWYLLNRLL